MHQPVFHRKRSEENEGCFVICPRYQLVISWSRGHSSGRCCCGQSRQASSGMPLKIKHPDQLLIANHNGRELSYNRSIDFHPSGLSGRRWGNGGREPKAKTENDTFSRTSHGEASFPTPYTAVVKFLSFEGVSTFFPWRVHKPGKGVATWWLMAHAPSFMHHTYGSPHLARQVYQELEI